jgi:hypothetical protein
MYLQRVHTVSTPDLLLDILPSMKMDNFIVWGIPLLLSFIGVILLLHPETIPFTLKTVGLLFLIRSFFVILTPMGIRPDQVARATGSFFQRLAFGNDFFFSGHVSLPFLLILVYWHKKWIRYAMLSSTLLFAMGVLLAHTHYSIDVFSVPFIVPSIYRLSIYIFPKDHERQHS